MKNGFFLIAGLMLVACAKNPQNLSEMDERDLRYHYFWSRSGATEQEFTKDLYDCETGIQQRVLMSTQAMNQYKYSRMNMGIFGAGLEEPEEIEEEDIPKMMPRCLTGHGWKNTKKTAFPVASYQYADEAADTHTYQRK